MCQAVEDKVDVLTGEVQSLRNIVMQVMDLTKVNNIPIALIRTICDTFQCRICHSIPLKPPAIVTRCCKVILGCEGCVNKWYSGPEALTEVSSLPI